MPEEKEDEFIRVSFPRGRVRCFDGKSRICRIPGRLKRKLWIRENDTILVEPWELDNEKGDIIFKYRDNQIAVLRKKGLIKDIQAEEF